VSEQLRVVLQDARRRTKGPHVVTYRGRSVASIRGGVAGAAKAAGIPYGRKDGATFHSIRHSVATWLGELGEPERARMEALGHADLATTQQYTHLRPVHQRPTLERLSTVVPISALVMAPGRRARRARTG
jgi:integrase